METYCQNPIQTSGFADAAYRMAVEAQKFEDAKNFKSAQDAHKQAS